MDRLRERKALEVEAVPVQRPQDAAAKVGNYIRNDVSKAAHSKQAMRWNTNSQPAWHAGRVAPLPLEHNL